MCKKTKLRNLEFGKFAEDKAAEYYIKNGYAIRERNWRYRHIEIDIIAQIDNVIVFVEVKARNGKDVSPLEAVTFDKMKNITKGADHYLRNIHFGNFEYRYDIFGLTGDFENYSIEVFEDAFLSPLLK